MGGVKPLYWTSNDCVLGLDTRCLLHSEQSAIAKSITHHNSIYATCPVVHLGIGGTPRSEMLVTASVAVAPT